jgi:aminopeptidase
MQDAAHGGGEIYFDDVLVRKDGVFALESLQGLNPDRLGKNK